MMVRAVLVMARVVPLMMYHHQQHHHHHHRHHHHHQDELEGYWQEWLKRYTDFQHVLKHGALPANPLSS